MQIASPPESLNPSPRGSYVARVLSNNPICREHFTLLLRVKDFPLTEPGQFVQLQSSERPEPEEPIEINWSAGQTFGTLGKSSETAAMLNRPFSLAGRNDDQNGATLLIIYRVVGVATAWLQTVGEGRSLTLIGPVGRRFTPPPGEVTPVLVGGGVGIPPMIYAAKTWGSGCAIAFCGAMSRDLLSLTMTGEPDRRGVDPTLTAKEFSDANVPVIITSDDGSIGRRGFVTDALVDWLAGHRETLTKIYACGPEPMLKRVAEIAAEFGVPCEVAVERAMACGLGTCQSCVIRVRDGDSWKYKLACTDGPVFDATTLLW